MTSGIQIVTNRNISKVTITDVEDRPGRAAEIFGTLGAQGFNVELVVSTGGREGRADISLAISRSQEAQVNEVMEKIRAEVGGKSVKINSEVALISLVGQGLSQEVGLAGRMFGSLSNNGINIEVISTSMSSVTCMIDEASLPGAEKALREEFDL
ncbi:MAG: ACT domain-containing protein [Candidatus Eisenbacteria bacterium]|uniref:aspartate kinase n=1 Tax=Eiseniibacteriota bacterium TaxID=2212470 RepID=A0A948W7R2_UNCEI|nr:ACT domain-containing protein [Candidatus Eisenbacteria bacterium]MBU1950889.1 ACT domain-containing protein [Candidatus Eisenbacteria bacterium]MBU2692859.1 ACT domain-containing protein [Candidatus Eisenbacteria bacterium]